MKFNYNREHNDGTFASANESSTCEHVGDYGFKCYRKKARGSDYCPQHISYH